MIEPELVRKGEDYGWCDPVYHLADMPRFDEAEDEACYEAHGAGEIVRLDNLRRVLSALYQEAPHFEDESDLADALGAALHVAFTQGWAAAKAYNATACVPP